MLLSISVSNYNIYQEGDPHERPITTVPSESQQAYDVTAHVETLYRDGITALKGAFSREWAEQMREDMMAASWEAIQRPGGAVGRGPRRWYVEIHPQDFRGFVDLVTHPWVTAMCEAVLGPKYEIVEIGFDTPFQGAKNQPCRRDFLSSRETYEEHRITSLAFNLTGVDVTPDMGPFEVAPAPSGTMSGNGKTRCSRRRRSGRDTRSVAFANIRRWATSHVVPPSPFTAARRIRLRSHVQ